MLWIHIACSLVSYAAFLVAFLAGLLFLVQEYQLKSKRMGWLFHRLPALETLDRVNFTAIGGGFALLTIGLGLGFFRSWRLNPGQWSWDAQDTVTLTLWGLYFLVWLVRIRSTIRGRKVAMLSMLGFALVTLTLLEVNWWGPSWHRHPAQTRAASRMIAS